MTAEQLEKGNDIAQRLKETNSAIAYLGRHDYVNITFTNGHVRVDIDKGFVDVKFIARIKEECIDHLSRIKSTLEKELESI